MNLRCPSLFLSTALAAPLLPAQGDTAVYEITFLSTWSQATHPRDFPANPHYSPLIGATHNSSAGFWNPGGLASPGIESMAETGGTTLLRSEISAAQSQGGAQFVVAGTGLGTSPGSVTVRFTATSSHPLLTLVTMLAPSPDWFVGVHGVDLRAQGAWIDKMVIPAHLYDAGTDSGTTYNSSNQDTQPRDKIARVTTASGAFQGLSTQVGTLSIQRIASARIYGCGINPKGSLAIVQGTPLLGQQLRVAVHDPSQAMTTGARTFLFFGITANQAFPCGASIPGFGMAAGSAGELLIDQIVANLSGPTWQGMPVPFDLNIPNLAGLIGADLYAQGVIGTAQRLGVTDGVTLHLGR